MKGYLEEEEAAEVQALGSHMVITFSVTRSIMKPSEEVAVAEALEAVVDAVGKVGRAVVAPLVSLSFTPNQPLRSPPCQIIKSREDLADQEVTEEKEEKEGKAALEVALSP